MGRGARIVFAKTDFVPEVFASLSRTRHPEPFVLLTHNSDLPVTARLFESAPACVSRWYALNVDHDAPRLVPIPSGMERPGGGGHRADYAKVPAAWDANTPVVRRHMAFGCWNSKNNIGERLTARRAFEGRPDVVWRTFGLGHHDFLRMCGESRFVISPPGNGIDCHRTWEAMYMGAIPIVRRSHHTNGFPDLPMALVEDWNSLTDDALSQMHTRYSGMRWNLDQLFFPGLGRADSSRRRESVDGRARSAYAHVESSAFTNSAASPRTPSTASAAAVEARSTANASRVRARIATVF